MIRQYEAVRGNGREGVDTPTCYERGYIVHQNKHEVHPHFRPFERYLVHKMRLKVYSTCPKVSKESRSPASDGKSWFALCHRG